jgi:hypothetical protein
VWSELRERVAQYDSRASDIRTLTIIQVADLHHGSVGSHSIGEDGWREERAWSGGRSTASWRSALTRNGLSYDAARVLDDPMDRVFVERPMSPLLVMVGGILRQNPGASALRPRSLCVPRTPSVLTLSLAWCPRFFAFTAIRGKTWQEPRRRPPHQAPKEAAGAGLFCCGRNLHASHVP